MLLNNRKGLLAFSSLILLGGGSSIPFITNSNTFANVFSWQGGGSSLAPYFSVGDKNNQNLHLKSSTLRPEKALEEVKNLETSNLDLTIEKPELKIEKITSTSNEKENIKNIYSEINKETKVLEIKNEKDKEWKKIEENVKEHRVGYSQFIESSKSTVEKIQKRQKRDVGEQFKRLPIKSFRYSLNPNSEEFNILREEINNESIKNKKALIKFYESYVQSLEKREELFKKLKDIEKNIEGGENKNIDMKKLKDYANYLKRGDQEDWKIDLSSKQDKNDPPETLLSKELNKLLERKYQEFQREIKEMEEGWQLALCKSTSSVWLISWAWGGEKGCHNTLYWQRENRDTLTRIAEFQILVKLLKEMKPEIQAFDIEFQ